MTLTLWWMAQNTLTAAMMIAIVLIACRWLQSRPALQHVLWLVVLVKFVTPPVVWWPWSAQAIGRPLARLVVQANPEPMARPSDSAVPAASSMTDAPLVNAPLVNAPLVNAPLVNAPLVDAPIADVPRVARPVDMSPRAMDFQAAMPPLGDASIAGGGLPEAADPAAESPSTRRPLQSTAASWLPWLSACVWLAGCAVACIVQLRRIVRYAAVVRRGRPAASPLPDEIARLAQKLRVRPLPVLVARDVMTPFVWCIGRLRLIWPARLAGGEELVRSRGILAHELAHVRRRDHWVAWIELAAGVIWWWNPLYWLVRRRLREAAEMACDALAINVLPDDRRTYAEMFLELSSACEAGSPAPALGVSTSSRGSFERRLMTMLSERVSGKVSAGGLLAAGLLALISLPAWSLDQTGPPQTGAESQETTPERRSATDASNSPDRFAVTLPAGASVEEGETVRVVAVARNPRQRNQWWAPDGTPVPAPGDELDFSVGVPASLDPEHEIALILERTSPRIHHGKSGQFTVPSEIRQDSRYPRRWAYIYRGFQCINLAQLVAQPPGVDRMTYRFSVAAGPWEKVATISGDKIQSHLRDVEVTGTEPREDEGSVKFTLNHTVDLDRFSLRMRARLRNGEMQDVMLPWDAEGRILQELLVTIHSIPLFDIAEFVLERSPFSHGEIHDIALTPKGGLARLTSAPPRATEHRDGLRITRTADVIEGEGWLPKERGLDLEKGQLHTPSIPESTKDGDNPFSPLRDWAARTNSDLIFSPDHPQPLLLGLDAVVVRDDSGAWFSAMSPNRQLTFGNHLLEFSKAGFPTPVSIPETLPAVFTLRTGEGNLGVLQVVEISDEDAAMHIRYRLRQKSRLPSSQDANAEPSPVQTSGGDAAGAANGSQGSIEGATHSSEPDGDSSRRLAARFGEVFERAVNSESVGNHSFIDLDTGQLLTPPNDLQGPKAFRQWLKQSGADAQGTVGGRRNIQGLACYDAVTIPMDQQSWSDPAQLEYFVACMQGTEPGFPTFMTGKGKLPETYLFKTREGRIGLLQIVELDDEPRAVRIRCKLVETNETPPQVPLKDRPKPTAPDPDAGVNGRTESERMKPGNSNRVVTISLHAEGKRSDTSQDITLHLDLTLAPGSPAIEQQDITDNWYLELNGDIWLIQDYTTGTPLTFRLQPGETREDHAVLKFRRTDEGIDLERHFPGGAVSFPHAVKIDPDTRWLDAGQRLAFPPGQHVLRIAFPIMSSPQPLLGDPSPRVADYVWSNPLTLTVVPDRPAPTQARQSQTQAEDDADAKGRHFVRLVVGPQKLTFQGREISWGDLQEELKGLSNRSSTVLEVAISTDEISVAKEREIVARAAAEAKKAGLDYASYIGIHELGSKGSESVNVGKETAGAAPAIPSKKPKHFVRLVVGKDSLRFVPSEADRQPGQKTTWNELPQLLEKVPNRSDTVFEVAIESEELSVGELNSTQGRAAALVQMFGFQYSSYVGVQPNQQADNPANDPHSHGDSEPEQWRPQSDRGESSERKEQRDEPSTESGVHWSHFELSVPTDKRNEWFLSLQDGRLHAPVPGDQPAVIVGRPKRSGGRPNLYIRFRDIHTVSLEREQGIEIWKTRTAEEHARLAANFFGEVPFERYFDYPIRPDELPLTISLTNYGLLQVTEIVEGESPLLKLRYKLLRQAGGKGVERQRSSDAASARFAPQEKTAEQVVADPATLKWGDPVDGVSVRLVEGGNRTLQAEVRNQGSNNWLVFCVAQFGRLEIDGTQYFWVGHSQGKSRRLSPGQQSDPFPVDYPDFWSRWATRDAKNRHIEPLRLSPGEHTLRFAPHLYPEDGGRESHRVWSQPVTIRVVDAGQRDAGTALKQRLKTSDNAESPADAAAGTNMENEAAVRAAQGVGGAQRDPQTRELSVRE